MKNKVIAILLAALLSAFAVYAAGEVFGNTDLTTTGDVGGADATFTGDVSIGGALSISGGVSVDSLDTLGAYSDSTVSNAIRDSLASYLDTTELAAAYIDTNDTAMWATGADTAATIGGLFWGIDTIPTSGTEWNIIVAGLTANAVITWTMLGDTMGGSAPKPVNFFSTVDTFHFQPADAESTSWFGKVIHWMAKNQE